MTNPIHRDPLAWWRHHCAEVEAHIEYRRRHNIPVPDSDLKLLAVAQEMCVKYVLLSLRDGE